MQIGLSPDLLSPICIGDALLRARLFVIVSEYI